MKRRWLLALGALLPVSLLCSCFAGFKPTETHAFNGSELINTSFGTPPSGVGESSSSSASSTSETVSSTTSEATVSKPEESVPNNSQNTGGQQSVSTVTHVLPKSAEYAKLAMQLSTDAAGNYITDDREKKLIENSLFVGDSICRGYSAYDIVSAKNVYAAGNVGARNFFEIEIPYYGQRQNYVTVLKSQKPRRVFLSMGINDVNMTGKEEFCENYRKIIDATLENSDAAVYVCAITPIDSDFSSNARIDSFNLALKSFISANYPSRVRFIDCGYVLKNSDNRLAAGLDSGDGIHLMPEAYHVLLLKICETLGIN